MNQRARVIAATKPIDPEFGKTAEEFIAYVARVSNPKNQWNHETAEKLLAYLEREGHWSPFEMYNIVVEVETTRDIARQILRHRSFSFQEFSQRYASVEDDFVLREVRLQDTKNRQNSLETDDENLKSEWMAAQQAIIEIVSSEYDKMLEAGVAKEVARAILPEGLTKTRLYINGNVRSWIHYLQARLDPSTQKEHRELAQMIEQEIRNTVMI